jgi:hypothetical protein
MLDKYGFTQTECILNEWNYVKGWFGDDIVYSHRQRRRIRGASFTTATMCACQYSPVDMLMYYDARPCENWNGMFDPMVVGRVFKGYYPFPMFNTLYRLGECVDVEDDQDAGGYICAAKNGNEAAILATHFNDDDTTEPKCFTIDITGFGSERGVEAEFFLLDDTHDCEPIGKAIYYSDRFTTEPIFSNFTTYLIKLKKL